MTNKELFRLFEEAWADSNPDCNLMSYAAEKLDEIEDIKKQTRHNNAAVKDLKNSYQLALQKSQYAQVLVQNDCEHWSRTNHTGYEESYETCDHCGKEL